MQGQAGAISSIMTKVEMAKYIHLHMWKVFAICKCENFLTFEWANSIETRLWTYNLLTGWSISYKSLKQFQFNLPHQMAKKITFEIGKRFSHLQMDIFCHFNFCHNRRNGFSMCWFIGSEMSCWEKLEFIHSTWHGIYSIMQEER